LKFGAAILGDISLSQVIRLSKSIENLGYDHIWVPDERFFRDIYSVMTTVAWNTSRVKIGTSITDPFIRHPALTATAIATVDEACMGRAILGIGAGISGFSQLGIKRDRPALAIREAVTVIRQLLAGKVVDFDGKVVKAKKLQLNFKPTRRSIPIYIAGRGPKILELAGEIADGVIIGALASKNTLAYAMQKIQNGLARSKRSTQDIDVVSWVYVSISDDGEQARDLVRPMVGYALLSSKSTLRDLGIREDVAGPIIEQLENLTTAEMMTDKGVKITRQIPTEIVDELSLAGSPEEIVNKVVELRQAGVKNIALLPFPPEGKGVDYVFSRFRTEVMSAIP